MVSLLVLLLSLPVQLSSSLFRREASAACTCPLITRAQIIDIAKSGVGCPYVWGGTCWDPANKTWKGADCSGYVTKCWQVPAASATTDCLPHYYTTATFYSETTHWTAISRSELLAGDSLVYRSGGSGHIILFESFTETSGCYQVYEARGTAYGIVHRVKCPDSTYQPRRRHNLTDKPSVPANQPPKGYLDDADCSSVRGWAYDPDAKDKPIQVHVYFDAPPGQPGAAGYPVTADQERPDLLGPLGSTRHGFVLPIPGRFRDGKPHGVRAYGIDTGGGQNPELSGGPRSISCSPVAGDAGPDPVGLDGGGAYHDAFVGPPPSYENPDDNRPEHDLTLSGSCGCQAAGGRALWLLPLLLALPFWWWRCRAGRR
jgi:hypothetical protein